MFKFQAGDRVFCEEYGAGKVDVADFAGCLGIPYFVIFENDKSSWCSGESLRMLSLKERLVDCKAIVKFRNGEVAALIDGRFCSASQLKDGNEVVTVIESLNEELQYDLVGNKSQYDIIAFKMFDKTIEMIRSLLQDKDFKWDWKRSEPKNMTMQELEKELGYPVKIVTTKE